MWAVKTKDPDKVVRVVPSERVAQAYADGMNFMIGGGTDEENYYIEEVYVESVPGD